MTRLFAAIAALLILGAAAPPKLTDADRRQALTAAASLIEQRYVDAEKGKQVANALRSASGDLSKVADPKQFARAVTDWLRKESGDGHLGLSYSEKAIPEQSGESGFLAGEMERWYGAQLNHGVEKIERLAGNIMLLDLRVFPPPEMAGEVIAAAMTTVAQGDALIIDLRQNGGGTDSVNVVTGYLVPAGSPLSGAYDRPSDAHRANTSPAWVPGRRFGNDKPLYILTSKRTFSAAEALAYDLQALKRAVIVGGRTGGGAHPFEYRRVHRHFALDLPEGKSVNPITGSNWQGVGVTPDVEVPPEQALERALELARDAIAKGRSAAGSDPRSLP